MPLWEAAFWAKNKRNFGLDPYLGSCSNSPLPSFPLKPPSLALFIWCSCRFELVLDAYIKPCQTPPNNLSHYQLEKRRNAMELDVTDFHRLELCLEGFFFGTISVYSQAQGC